MQVPTKFTVSPNTQTGDVYATNFEVFAKFPDSYVSFTWNFGDGNTFYNSPTASHKYNYPGIYTVSLSAWTPEGFLIRDAATVNVDYVYRDAIVVDKLPSAYGVAGLPTADPFVISLTSAKIDQPIGLVLQSLGTQSIPHYAVSEKRKHITPKWRFVDANTNKTIDDVYQIATVPIYKGTEVVAVTGQASFYYIDDLASFGAGQNQCPLLIVASLSALHFTYPPESLIYPYRGYSNSEVTRAFINWQISPAITTDLFVTENYINGVYPIKWSNIPIPVMITCKFDKNKLGNAFTTIPPGIVEGDVLSYPKTNLHGSQSTLKLVLSTSSGLVPENLYSVEVKDVSYPSSSAPLYFQTRDEENHLVNGYVFTTITPLSPIYDTTVVAASTVTTNEIIAPTEFNFPGGYPIRPHVYVSHPKSGTINKISTTSYDESDCKDIQHYASSGILAKGTFETLRTPILSSVDLSTYTLSGNTAVYGMGMDPIKNRLYACDADDDTVYVFDENSVMISAVNIAAITGEVDNIPSYVSIDENSNIWISLYGNQRLLKLDSEFNLLAQAVPATSLPLTAGASGNFFVEPPIVETNSDNDVWACYCHPVSSMLIKYDGNTGSQLLSVDSVSFPVSSVPVSLSIDPLDNVWVSCYDSNEIRCYNGFNGSLLYTFDGFIHPSYTAFDRYGRLWFTHGYNKLSVIDVVTTNLSSWEVRSVTQQLCSISNTYTAADINNALTLNEIWGGLIVDVFNNVWVIDSDYNNTYTFSVDSPESFSTIKLFPNPTSNYIVLGAPNTITTIPLSSEIRSAQAGGDWCGNKWYQKYTRKYANHPVYGVSDPFKVYHLDDSFKIAKINEEFNTSKYFKDLALPEVLNQNEELFGEFLAAAVGNGIPSKDDIGRIVYERIANFVQTHSNFETAEIPQLLSFAKQMSVKAHSYGYDFPNEINRLLNLFSINTHYLRGQVDYEPDITDNIGSIITASEMISANTYIIMKDIILGTYQEVYVDISNAGDYVYPLSSIDIEGTKRPLFDNYYFFRYKPNTIGYKNNIINWESDFTTLAYETSTYEEWYGDDGVVEIMFNNLLTKKLFT